MTLEEYMKSSRLTYRQLGELWGVTAATIHHWVSGKAKPLAKNKRLVKRKTKGLVTFD